jgi:transposase
MKESPYDLTDVEWCLIEPLLPKPGVDKPPDQDFRLVINAILFLIHTGAALRTVPPWSTAESYYWQWQADGTWHWITGALQADRPGVLLPRPHPLPKQ